jgi:hypothetical protein
MLEGGALSHDKTGACTFRRVHAAAPLKLNFARLLAFNLVHSAVFTRRPD